MRRFLSLALPYIFLIHSGLFFYLSFQVFEAESIGTVLFDYTSILFPSPLNFLLLLLTTLPLPTMSFIIYNAIVFTVFFITIASIFLGLIWRVKIALYILMLSALAHTFVSFFLLNRSQIVYGFGTLFLITGISIFYFFIFWYIKNEYP